MCAEQLKRIGVADLVKPCRAQASSALFYGYETVCVSFNREGMLMLRVQWKLWWLRLCNFRVSWLRLRDCRVWILMGEIACL